MEELAQGDPRALALENARRKALAVPGELVLGADTDVALDGEVLGKPRDAAQARELLAPAHRPPHEVVGGIAIAEHGEIIAQDVVVTARRRSGRSTTPRSTGTSRPASGRAAPAATRSRAAAPPSSRGSRATT